MTEQELGETLISARLLILQSKRLMLSSLQRRRANATIESLQHRVERLVGESESAWTAYRQSMLRWGSPKRNEYWLVAYSHLIDRGHALTDKLSEASAAMPPDERYELAVEVEKLQEMVDSWRGSIRSAIVGATA